MARLSESATHAMKRSASRTALLPREAAASFGSGACSVEEELSAWQPEARAASARVLTSAERGLRIGGMEAAPRKRFRPNSPGSIFQNEAKSPPARKTHKFSR